MTLPTLRAALLDRLTADPAAAAITLRMFRSVLVEATFAWAGAGDNLYACELGALTDVATDALGELARALDDAAEPSACPTVTRAPTTTTLFCGERVAFCGPECAYHYQERCPDVAHLTEAT